LPGERPSGSEGRKSRQAEFLQEEKWWSRDCGKHAQGMFSVFASLRSLGFASRPKLPVGNFVE